VPDYIAVRSRLPTAMNEASIPRQIDDDHHSRQAVLDLVCQPGRVEDRQEIVVDEAACVTGLAGSLPEAVPERRQRADPAARL